MEGIVVGGIVVLLAVWVISTQRKLTGMEENLKDAMNQVGVLLSTRLETLTALLDRLQSHTRRKAQELLSTITPRQCAITADSGSSEIQAQECRISEILADFSAKAERLPELKTDENYTKFLSAVDSYGKMVRTSCLIYNDNVTKWNRELQVFPISLLAKLFGFRQREPLEIGEEKE